ASRPGSGRAIAHVAWDPLARIELSTLSPEFLRREFTYPAFLGHNPAFMQRVKYVLTQNNWAFTLAPEYDGTPESLVGLEEAFHPRAYDEWAVATPRVLVIGVGVGFDVLSGIAFGASRVTAAEINAATVRILTRTYRHYFHHWVEDPRVQLVNAEGRSFLTTT